MLVTVILIDDYDINFVAAMGLTIYTAKAIVDLLD